MSARETTGQPVQAIRRFLIALLILAVGASSAIYVSRRRLLAVPEQPIAYSHQSHIEAGIECLYCHTQAMRSTIAGIPSVERCMGCHQVISVDDEGVQQLASYAEQGEAIPWARVNRQPDFVYFSHRPHLGAGVNCETCHGAVSTMDVARPVLSMDMGWCLECHKEQDPEHVTRLVDCLACHK